MYKTLFISLFALTLAHPTLAKGTTDSVWSHHIEAWNNRDLTEIVADYSENAVIVVNNRTFRGKSEIRDLFSQLFRIFDGAKNHEIDPATVIDEIVYITWRADIENAPTFGTDTFVIREGEIRYQTIAFSPGFDIR